MEDLTDYIADTYSASATYNVGDLVIHEGDLYQCTSQITTAEQWTAAHWSKTNIGDEVSDLKSALDDVSNFAKTRDFKWRDGYRIATNTTVVDTSAVYPSAAYACLILEVSKGETFKLTAHASNSIYNAYCFTDTSKNKLNISGPGTFTNTEIVAPEDGYLICCTDNLTMKGLVSPESLSQMKAEVDEIYPKSPLLESIMFPQSMFEQGTFGSSGSEAESQYAIRIKEKIKTTRSVMLIPNSGYSVFVVKYNKRK